MNQNRRRLSLHLRPALCFSNVAVCKLQVKLDIIKYLIKIHSIHC